MLAGIARRQPFALSDAYRRHAAAVHALSTDLHGPAAAPAVTVDVFLDLWHTPGRYTPPNGGSLRLTLLAATEHRTPRPHADPGARPSLADLPANERQAVALARYAPATYQQVAVTLDRPEPAIRADIRAGLRRLRHRQ